MGPSSVGSFVLLGMVWLGWRLLGVVTIAAALHAYAHFAVQCNDPVGDGAILLVGFTGLACLVLSVVYKPSCEPRTRAKTLRVRPWNTPPPPVPGAPIYPNQTVKPWGPDPDPPSFR